MFHKVRRPAGQLILVIHHPGHRIARCGCVIELTHAALAARMIGGSKVARPGAA